MMDLLRRAVIKIKTFVPVLIAVLILCASSETMPAADLPNGSCEKTYIGSGAVHENFGAREAPYEGFLVFSKPVLPEGYLEKSHHYTKSEYLVLFERIADNVKYDIDITESDQAKFFEPGKQNLVKEFTFRERNGRVFAYREHLTERPALALYWYNPPKQRLSISLEQDPAHPFSPDDLIKFLEAMTPAIGVPALVEPCPKSTPASRSKP